MILSALLITMGCEVRQVRLCDHDDFSYACAGKSTYQLVCEANSRKMPKESIMKLKELLSQDMNLLFHFQGEDFDLVEVKKLGLPESAPKSEVYQWLKISRLGEFEKLHFSSMDTNSRTFTEGKLEFDDHVGTFSDDRGIWKLKRKPI